MSPPTPDQPQTAPPRTDEPRGRPRRWVKWLVLLVVLGAAATWFGFRLAHRQPGPGAGTRAGGQPVPVVIGEVAQRDVPIYLNGLGTVQAFNSVTVHSRVDGQLLQVLFTEGQDVKAGEVLAEIDPAPYQAVLDQVTAKKAQDEAQLTNARLDLQRYIDLLKTESTTRQTYETQKALLAQLEATVKADQAAIDSARVNFDYTKIRSPLAARAGLRQVDPGNIVRASDPGGLVTLTQLRPISVVFTLPEQNLPQLQSAPGGLNFIVLALGRDNTNTLAQGKLAVIDNQIDTTTGTIKLKATFENEDLHLWPGQFVNTRLLLTTRHYGVVVPASVVQRGPEGPFAFVVQPDQTVQMRPLKVAQIEQGEALIDDGLAVGEHVVVDGQYKLTPGARVKPVEAEAGSKRGPATSPNRRNP